MARNGTAANAANAFILVTPDGKIRFQTRSAQGAATASQGDVTEAPAVWLRLVRSGEAYSGYYGTDGSNWTQVGNTATISSIPTTAEVGLAVTSHDTGALATANISEVKLDGSSFGGGSDTGDPELDTTAPTVPSGLSVTGTTESSVSLSWSSSTDDTRVANYIVYRDGSQIATPLGLTYTDTGVASDISYTYTVSAVDAAGNESGQSTSASGTADIASEANKVLFLGNSFTIGGNASVPEIFDRLAISGGHHDPDTVMRAVPGQRFSFHASDATSQNEINSKPWTHVVLQNYSTEPTHIGNVQNHLTYGTQLYDQIMANHAETEVVLFETWSRAANNSIISGTSTDSTFASTAEMQSELRLNYGNLALQLNTDNPTNPAVVVAPVGDAWENAGGLRAESDPEFTDLHGGDNYHGNDNGYFLTAAVIYSTIYGVSPEGLLTSSDIASLNLILTEDPEFLAQVAWATVLGDFTDDAPDPDLTPPSIPAGLGVSGETASELTLSWSASTDDTGVSNYVVYRDGVQVATPSGSTYTDTGLSPETSYTYTVRAIDAAGNESAPSPSVSTTTPATDPNEDPEPSGIPVASRSYPNLVYNPSFEYEDFFNEVLGHDWTEFWFNRDYLIRDTSQASDGAVSLRAEGPLSNAYTFQNSFALQPDTDYRLSIRVRAEGGLTGNGVRLVYDQTAPRSAELGSTAWSGDGDGSWERIEGTFSTASDYENGWLRILFDLASGERVWIDEVEVAPVSGTVPLAAMPTLQAQTPAAGPAMVTINSTTPGGTVHYTTDGSDPTIFSVEYRAPFPVSADARVKARVFKNGLRESDVAFLDVERLGRAGPGDTLYSDRLER